MSKPKKAVGSQPKEERTYWQRYYAAHKDKYRAWAKAWREKQKALKAANVAVQEEPKTAPVTKAAKPSARKGRK